MSAYPYLLIVEQHEKLVYEYIKSKGRDVGWQTELKEFSQDEQGVTGTIVNASVEQQRVHARYLVA